MFDFNNSRFSRFCSDSKGSVAIIVGVMLLLIIAILMVTVDLGQMQSGKTNNQAAIDASVLGTAEYVTRYRVGGAFTGQPNDYQTYARKILDQNLAEDQSSATVDSFQAIVGGTIMTASGPLTASTSEVLVYACLSINTRFSATLHNGATKQVCNYSKATLPGFGNSEVVFALDVSSSMADTINPGGYKLEKLQEAVKDVIADYVASNPPADSVYFAVVPFTGIVDIGNNARNIVFDDRNTATNAAELITPSPPSPADQTRVVASTPNNYYVRASNYDSFFDYREDQYVTAPHTHFHSIGSVFNSSDDGGVGFFNNSGSQPFNIPAHPYSKRNNPSTSAMDALQRLPLTTRTDGTTSFIDNRKPVGSAMFQGYWHQPNKYYITYDDTTKACGVCEPSYFDYEEPHGSARCQTPTKGGTTPPGGGNPTPCTGGTINCGIGTH